MLQLYKNIKARREELGWTQEELAEKMGYSHKSMITKIEKGLVDLPTSKILAFASVMGVCAGDLMGEDGISDSLDDLDASELILVSKFRELDERDKGYIEGQIDSLLEKKTERMEGDVNVG